MSDDVHIDDVDAAQLLRVIDTALRSQWKVIKELRERMEDLEAALRQHEQRLGAHDV